MASYEERNALKPIMHEHDNLKGNLWRRPGQNPEDAIKQKTIVIVMEVAAKLEPAKDYKRLALSPRQWKNQALAVNSQIPTSGEDLYLLLSFYDTYIYHSEYY